MTLQQSFIKSISIDFEKAENEAKEIIEQYDNQAFTNKPESGGWSAAQCFGHMAKLNGLYEERLHPILEQHKNRKLEVKDAGLLPIKHSFMGKLLMKSLKPGSTTKIPAPKVFNPIDNADQSAVEDFLQGQKELNAVLKELEVYPLSKIKIPSPVTSLIKLRLCDAFQMIAWHNLRHVEQAKRALVS